MGFGFNFGTSRKNANILGSGEPTVVAIREKCLDFSNRRGFPRMAADQSVDATNPIMLYDVG